MTNIQQNQQENPQTTKTNLNNNNFITIYRFLHLRKVTMINKTPIEKYHLMSKIFQFNNILHVSKYINKTIRMKNSIFPLFLITKNKTFLSITYIHSFIPSFIHSFITYFSQHTIFFLKIIQNRKH